MGNFLGNLLNIFEQINSLQWVGFLVTVGSQNFIPFGNNFFLTNIKNKYVYGFFQTILLFCQSCKNGYSDNQHCLQKIHPI